MRRWLALFVVAALSACGGRAQQAQPTTSNGGRAGQSQAEGGAGLALAGKGGAAAEAGATDEAGAAGQGSGCPSYLPDACDENGKPHCTWLLRDADNCGVCGNACKETAACEDGQCTEAPVDLASVEWCDGRVSLAVANDVVYWVENQPGRVRSVPIGGGTATTLAEGEGFAQLIAADTSGVYWADWGNGEPGTMLIRKLAPGGVPTTLYVVPSTGRVEALALTGEQLCFNTGHDVRCISTDESSASDELVATALNTSFNPLTIEGTPNGIAVSGSLVFWSNPQLRTIQADDLLPGIGPFAELATGQDGLLLGALAARGSRAFWATAAEFKRADALRPGEVELVAVAPADARISAFAIDDTTAYLASRDGSISKHALSPSLDSDRRLRIATAIARGQDEPSSLALTPTQVVWATADCVIRRAPR